MVLDACVLFPTVMREVLVGCAAAGLYEPRWSARILEEWARATAKIGAEVIARGEVAVLRARWPGAEVQVPEAALARFWLPDPNDIHVLAAAVLGHADLIITLNAQDFPRHLLAAEGGNFRLAGSAESNQIGTHSGQRDFKKPSSRSRAALKEGERLAASSRSKWAAIDIRSSVAP